MATPSYEQSECDVCAERRQADQRAIDKGQALPCHDCGQPIPKYVNVDAGFDSFTADHKHFKQVQGRQGLQPVKRRLCRDCLAKDFELRYPGKKYPIKDAPPKITL